MTMTHAQAFSLNEWLSDYPDDMPYEKVIELIRNDDDRVTAWIWFEHTPPETLIENIDNTLSHFENVTAQMKADVEESLQVMWEQLNGALHDIRDGDPADAESAIEDCIIRLELLGVHK